MSSYLGVILFVFPPVNCQWVSRSILVVKSVTFECCYKRSLVFYLVNNYVHVFEVLLFKYTNKPTRSSLTYDHRFIVYIYNKL